MWPRLTKAMGVGTIAERVSKAPSSMPKASFGKHCKTVILNRLAVISIGLIKPVVRIFAYAKTIETPSISNSPQGTCSGYGILRLFPYPLPLTPALPTPTPCLAPRGHSDSLESPQAVAKAREQSLYRYQEVGRAVATNQIFLNRAVCGQHRRASETGLEEQTEMEVDRNPANLVHD